MIITDEELEKRKQSVMRSGRVRDLPEKQPYSLWTDIASTIPEFAKGVVEGEVDLVTTLPTFAGYYNPQKHYNKRLWYSVDKEAGILSGVSHSVGHFLSSFGTGFISSGFNPAVGVATASVASGTRTVKELRDEGVDLNTARTGGAVSAGATYVGGQFAGVYGKSLVTKAVTGGVTNVAFGLGERQTIGKRLEEKGYPELAKQYSQLEATQIGAELIIGGFLGGLHGKKGHFGSDIKPHEVDIAQVVKNDIDDILTSSQGIPTTHQSSEIHASTLEQAIESMGRGEDITVDPVQMDLMAKEMISKPELKLSPELNNLLKQGEELSPKQKEVRTPIEHDPLSPRVPEYERRLMELEQTFAHEPEIKEKITRDIELSKKDVFKAALNCLFGV
ncbi:hypothetical protein [Candidatus Liberibacter americanus]|uniref:Uncharacterized protein n=1 Tax=Candidatus Liberibacter americanus str. Sao Paulo TaxID=1261131 RepID=U6B4P7_9HYPH|nr:hypothetical protein [Candidatus Liberibacter americanus]AHA28044.1 hypothetical protein lam_698 [Candidatus Liberibacter americanus str. Sao Paulo]EMS35819.1 hypothetical protein G653_04721 [Candidatus Liberibacter americanus PW_SP]